MWVVKGKNPLSWSQKKYTNDYIIRMGCNIQRETQPGNHQGIVIVNDAIDQADLHTIQTNPIKLMLLGDSCNWNNEEHFF